MNLHELINKVIENHDPNPKEYDLMMFFDADDDSADITTIFEGEENE